VHGWRFPLL